MFPVLLSPLTLFLSICFQFRIEDFLPKSFQVFKEMARETKQRSFSEKKTLNDLLSNKFTLSFSRNSNDSNSRNNFNTKESHQVFINRERTRDMLHNFLRGFQITSNKFGKTRIPMESLTKLSVEVSGLFQFVMEENYFWLAEFFFEVLIQTCCSDIEDPKLSELKERDPEKLWRLQKRFSFANKENFTRGEKILSEIKQAKRTQVEDFFSQKELFFFHFISFSNNYCFLRILSQILSSRLSLLSKRDLPNPPSTHELLQTILQLKTVSKVSSQFFRIIS